MQGAHLRAFNTTAGRGSKKLRGRAIRTFTFSLLFKTRFTVHDPMGRLLAALAAIVALHRADALSPKCQSAADHFCVQHCKISRAGCGGGNTTSVARKSGPGKDGAAVFKIESLITKCLL